MLCGVDYKWQGEEEEEEEEGDRLLAAEQVGMQLLAGWYANEWVGGWLGQSSAALLHLKRQLQKWPSDIIDTVTHKPALCMSVYLHQHNNKRG